jgi:hypothetical protein
MRSRMVPLLLFAMALAASVRAEPVTHPPGPVLLPLTGLRIALPKDRRPGHTWSLASSFALEDGGASFDARDVVDEKLGDRLVSATWVSVGHFTAGGCDAVLAALPLGDVPEPGGGQVEGGATGSATPVMGRKLWGSGWSVRGGRIDLGAPLGTVPVVTLCGARPGRKALLLYHLRFDSEQVPESVLDVAERHAVVRSVALAWREDAIAEQQPLLRPEVRDRGGVRPARKVRFEVSGLEVALPEDGHVWVPRASEPGKPPEVDWIDRLAPAMPELTVEFMRLPNATCAQFLAAIDAPEREGMRPRDLPEGWLAGPVLEVEGELEHLACHPLTSGVLVVGLYANAAPGSPAGSFRPLHGLLGALVRAAEVGKPDDGGSQPARDR